MLGVAEYVVEFSGTVWACVIVEIRKTPFGEVMQIGVERLAFVAKYEERATVRATKREKGFVTATVETTKGDALLCDPRRLEHSIN